MPCLPCLPVELVEELKNDFGSSSKIFDHGFEKSRRAKVKLNEREPVVDTASSRARKENRKRLLHKAASEGDVPLVYELIRLGEIDQKDEHGKTALYGALSSLANPTPDLDISKIESLVRIATLLIEQYTDANTGFAGVPPLSLAVKAHRWDLVELLLLHGARPLDSTCTDEADLERLRNLQATVKGKPHPPRPCPCWSGKLLSECHNSANEQPYPDHFLCVCGTRYKTYADCCCKRGIEIVEKWNRGRLSHRKVTRLYLPSQSNVSSDIRDLFNRGVEIITQRVRMRDSFFTEQQTPESGMGKSERLRKRFQTVHREKDMDEAFWVIFDLANQFDPPRPWATEISKLEAQRRMKDWNDAVDRYIDDDPESDVIEIEIEFKIGLHGGPLYRSCEADGCYKTDSYVEGLEEFGIGNMKCCSACRRIFYCSERCQKKDWKDGHKDKCEAGTHPLQLLAWQWTLEQLQMGSIAMLGGMPTNISDETRERAIATVISQLRLTRF